MMEVKIIDGKAISAEIRSELVVKTEKVKKELGVVPGLSVIMVGDDLASAVYVRNKEKAAAEALFKLLGVQAQDRPQPQHQPFRVPVHGRDAVVF